MHPWAFFQSSKTWVHANTCIGLCITAVLLTHIQKEVRGPSMGEWVNKPSNTHAMENYSAMKRNKVIYTHTLDESWGNCAKWKKLLPKGYILYDSTYVIFFSNKTRGVGISLVGIRGQAVAPSGLQEGRQRSGCGSIWVAGGAWGGRAHPCSDSGNVNTRAGKLHSSVPLGEPG